MHELKMHDVGDAIRHFIVQNRIGCNGLKIQFADGQHLGSHIRRNAFPIRLIGALDNGSSVYF